MKKRMRALLLSLICLLSCFPSVSLAASSDTARSKEAVIRQIRSHTDLAEETFTIQTNTTMCELFCLYDQTLLDQAMISCGIAKGGCTWTTSGLVRTITFYDLTYYPGQRMRAAFWSGDDTTLTAREQEALRIAEQVVSALTGTDLEKERSIHDYLCQHVAYDESEDEQSGDLLERDTAVGALLNGAADCDGFSDAFYLLCSMAGIEARRVIGSSTIYGNVGSHMWNAVQIDGQWCFVDVAFDCLPSGQWMHLYFNIGTDQLSQDHTWYPDALDYDVISRNDPLLRPADIRPVAVADGEELRSLIRTAAKNRSERIFFTCSEDFPVLENPSWLNDILSASGVIDGWCEFLGHSFEIIGLSYYDHFAFVDTEAEALTYIKQCKKIGIADFTLICAEALYQDLMDDRGRKIISLLSAAGYQNPSIYYDSDYCHIMIGKAY